MRSLLVPAALGLVVVTGCGDGPTMADGGHRLDAATPRDAAVPPDARTPDASTPGIPDAGRLDASRMDDASTLPDVQTGDGGVSGGWSATALVPWSRIIGTEPDATILDLELVMDGGAAHVCAALQMRTGITTYERRVLYATNEGGAMRVEVVLVGPDQRPARCSIAIFEGAPYVASSATRAESFALQRRTAAGAWEAVPVELEATPDDVSEVTVHALRADAEGLALLISRRHEVGSPFDPDFYDLRAARRTASGWSAWMDAGSGVRRAGLELEGGVLTGATTLSASRSAALWTLDLSTGTPATRAVADGSVLPGSASLGVAARALVGAPVVLSTGQWDCEGFSCSALVLTRAPEGEEAVHHVLAERRVGVFSTARCGDEAMVMHVDGTSRTLHTSTAGAAPVATTLTVATESTVLDEAFGVDCASGRMVLVTARRGELVAFESP